MDDPHTEHKGIQFIRNFHKTGHFTLCVYVRELMELYSNYSKYTQNHLEFVKFGVNLYKVTC